jgi:8-oxo-dGTP diphosphatase
VSDSERPRVGIGVLVVRDDLILLGKRCGEHIPGYYAAPGGHLEFGESFVECAKREVLEETGLVAQNVQFLMIGNYRFGTKHYVDIDMLAECPDGEPVAMEPDKCAEWKWYHRDSLPSPLFLVTERMIESYIKGYNSDADSIEKVLEQR